MVGGQKPCIIAPSIFVRCSQMNVTIVVPFVVVGVVLPLKSLHGLPYEHEYHTSHP